MNLESSTSRFVPVRRRALIDLGEQLLAAGYDFTTVTPSTHARVNRKAPPLAHSLRDVFGWNRCFEPELLPKPMLRALVQANALGTEGGLLRSQVRFATRRDRIFMHSAFPTSDTRSVFFGPDTYRFCSFLEESIVRARRVVDVGTGSGVGGIVASAIADEVVVCDVNPSALAYADVNAALNHVPLEIVESDVLARVDGPFDLVIANPPFMADVLGLTYRDGGGAHGEALSVRIAREALERLPPGGSLAMYTGAAIVDGQDVLLDALVRAVSSLVSRIDYFEIDADIFGEELEQPPYVDVERIAAVGLIATR